MTDAKWSTQIRSHATSISHLRFLRAVRAAELRHALVHFPPPNHTNTEQQRIVLEIGAGTGQQAKLIAAEGYTVVAIDLPSSHYRDDRVYKVTEYDGRTIPMPSEAVDVVFSSNVLEHVSEIDAFLDETYRVMAEGGIAVHILPSSACRLWSIPAHYIWLTKRLYARVNPLRKPYSPKNQSPVLPRTPGSPREWLGTFFPLRHGERGLTLSEAYYYSRYWWCRKFQQHGFAVVSVDPNKLFYTMANSLADSVSIGTRAKLSRFLGSACNIYVLKRCQDLRDSQKSSRTPAQPH